MATFFFETITAVQAAGFNAASDNLVFGVAGVTAASVQAAVNGDGTVTVVAQGKTVTFNASLVQESPLFPDSSRLAFGTTGADSFSGTSGGDQLMGAESGDTLSGLGGGDYLVGGAAADSLSGGEGADTLRGGTGEDTLSGGAGADVYDFDRGDTSQSTIDTITDWSVLDLIRIAGGGGSYVEESQSSSSELIALSRANSLTSGGARVVVMGLPTGVMVYTSSGGVVENSVRLVGRTLDDISAANVAGASDPGVPPTPPQPATPLMGTAAADTLAGGASSDAISGFGGDDQLSGGGGADTIDGNDGADTINGGAGADRMDGGSGADVFIIANGESPPATPDIITNLEVTDRLVFAGGNLRADFESLGELTFDKGLAFANSRIGAGLANFVLMRTNDGTFLFVDSNNDDGVADEAVRIVMSTGQTFSLNNLATVSAPDVPAAVPPAPSVSTGNRLISIHGNLDLLQPADVLGAFVTEATDTTLRIQGSLVRVSANGTGFTYASNQLVGGTVTNFTFVVDAANSSPLVFNAGNVSFPAASLGFWVASNAATEALSTILAGSDQIEGSGGSGSPPDLIRGFGGNDLIRGNGGNDTIFGGAGDDVIYANREQSIGSGTTYLRGDEGADYIVGGAGFDDINGNMGNDTGVGGAGDDWVVGGKDQDLLFGQAGNDLVYGNLGNDTCEGGDGADTIRGGQEDDAVRGGAGDDYVSGDRGSDTMTGGAGADLFHTFGEAGIDRVTDFKIGEGDRVLLDPGTQYSVAQVGTDVVITMSGGGGQMTLVGVQLSSLPAGWIFGN